MTELRHFQNEPRADPAKLKALVIDDQELNRRVMSLLLREFGCSPTLAASGDEGVQFAAAARFDMIVMDLNMPGIDGDETTRRIRKAGASRSVFVVRWTTETDLWLDPGLYDAKAPKPITLQALNQVISEAARRCHGPRLRPRDRLAASPRGARP